MNSKTGIAFSIVAIAVVIVLFASGPLVTTHQAMAFPGRFGGFHHFGFFHRGFGFHHFGFFHRGFGFGFPGFGFGSCGCGC